MNRLRTWKIIGGLVLLFGLGGICGAAYTAGLATHAPATDKWSERWFMQTAGHLEVRDDQMQALRPMLDDMQRQLRDLQQETTTRAKTIINQTGRRMWEVLDATQREKYRALERDQKLSRKAASESTPIKTGP